MQKLRNANNNNRFKSINPGNKSHLAPAYLFTFAGANIEREPPPTNRAADGECSGRQNDRTMLLPPTVSRFGAEYPSIRRRVDWSAIRLVGWSAAKLSGRSRWCTLAPTWPAACCVRNVATSADI